MRGKSFLFILLILGSTAYANAYAVLPNGQPVGNQSSGPSTAATSLNANYDFNGSFQNLISPFESFMRSLQWNNSTNIMVHPISTSVPPTNITPGLQNAFTQFDNWFYALTNIRLSGFFAVIATSILWILEIAKGIADWLLRLIRN